MGEGVEVGGTAGIANPETLLAGCFKTGVVAFAFCAQGINSFKAESLPVNGKAVIGGQSDISGTTPVFLSVVPVFMVTRTNAGSGLAERAAEFLADTPIVGGLSIPVHGKASLANGIANRELLCVLCAALIKRNHGFSLVDVFHQVVDSFHIVAFVGDEGTLPKRQDGVGEGKDVRDRGGVRHVGGGGELIEGQSGDAVHQHMVFISPVKLITPLIMLVGSGMDTQGAIRVGFGMVLRIELISGKGFWIVLFGVGGNRGRTRSARIVFSSGLFI